MNKKTRLKLVSIILAAMFLCQPFDFAQDSSNGGELIEPQLAWEEGGNLPLAIARDKFTGGKFGNLRPVAVGEREQDLLPPDVAAFEQRLNGAASAEPPTLMKRINGVIIRAALEAGADNKAQAARLLGLTPSAFAGLVKRYASRGCIPDTLTEDWRRILFRGSEPINLRVLRDEQITGMACRMALDATGEYIPEAAKLLGIGANTLDGYIHSEEKIIPDELDAAWYKVLFAEVLCERFITAGVSIFYAAEKAGGPLDPLYNTLFKHRTDVVSLKGHKTPKRVKEEIFFEEGKPAAIDRIMGMMCRLALEDSPRRNIVEAAKAVGISRGTFYTYEKRGLLKEEVSNEWKAILCPSGRFMTKDDVRETLYRLALKVHPTNKSAAARLLGVDVSVISRWTTANPDYRKQKIDPRWIAACFKNGALIAEPHPVDEKIATYIQWIGDTKTKWLSQEQLREKTREFKAALKSGASLNNILPEAFAIFGEAVFRSSGKYRGMRPAYEQVLAALAIHRGKAVEVEPGEGKTLAIAMAAYLNALTDKGVHVHTFNDYLAKRDGEDMWIIFSSLGLTTGVVVDSKSYAYVSGLSVATRHEAYLCDVTYGPKEQFGFDFLWDNRILNKAEKNKRENAPEITIVDEGESSLIDEGHAPLIITGPANGFSPAIYIKIWQIVAKDRFRQGQDYEVDRENETILLKEYADARIQELFRSAKELRELRLEEKRNLVRQALTVKEFFHRNEDYIVRGKKVIIVDKCTGRLKEMDVWGNHIQQFVQASLRAEGEDVKISRSFIPAAQITYQSLYRRAQRGSRLAIISGTIGEDAAQELKDVYGLAAVKIPLQHDLHRDIRDEVMFDTEAEKDAEVMRQIREINHRGNPILIFKPNIREAKELFDKLKENAELQRWLAPNEAQLNIIDGQEPESEARIISRAGHVCQITIATNAAGRGVHFELEKAVKDSADGAVVIRTYQNDNWRADEQQSRRVGIRGEKGLVLTFRSRQDKLNKRWPGANPQASAEAYYRRLRNKTLKYDEELDGKREEFYGLRNIVLNSGLMEDERVHILKDMDELWMVFLGNIENEKNLGTFESYCETCRRDFSTMMIRILDSERINVRAKIPNLATARPLPDAQPVFVTDLADTQGDLLSGVLRPRPGIEREDGQVAADAEDFVYDKLWLQRAAELTRTILSVEGAVKPDNSYDCHEYSLLLRDILDAMGIKCEIVYFKEHGHWLVKTHDGIYVDAYPEGGGGRMSYMIRRSQDVCIINPQENEYDFLQQQASEKCDLDIPDYLKYLRSIFGGDERIDSVEEVKERHRAEIEGIVTEYKHTKVRAIPPRPDFSLDSI